MACPKAESGAIEGMASSAARGRLFLRLVARSLYGYHVPFLHRARIDRRLHDVVLEGPPDRPVAEGMDILSLADQLEQLDIEQSQLLLREPLLGHQEVFRLHLVMDKDGATHLVETFLTPPPPQRGSESPLGIREPLFKDQDVK